MNIDLTKYLASSPCGNFFLLAGPCAIEGEQMALDIAGSVKEVTDHLGIPYVFKGSYRKANRSRLASFPAFSAVRPTCLWRRHAPERW